MIEGLEVPPELFHIRTGGVGRPRGRVLIPTFQYGVRSAGVRPSRGSLQTRPDLHRCLLRSPPGVLHQGPSDGYSEPPHQVSTVAIIPVQGRTLINQPDGILGHPEGERRAFHLGGYRFQGLEGLKIIIGSAQFRGGGY